MFKIPFFIIMIIMMSFQVNAKSFVQSHEQFVHMSDKDKNEFIKKIMELMVELESRYEKDVKKYGYNQERFEKFQNIVKVFKEAFLIESAYAQASTPSSEWLRAADSFMRLAENTTGNKKNCVFAGWVSSATNGLCSHPGFAGGDITSGYIAPPARNNGTCTSGNRRTIQCNPAVFGFRNAQSGTLFCVASDNSAINSSYHCMQLALGIKQDGLLDEKGNESVPADPVSDRLAFLRTRLQDRPEIFSKIHELIYKSCVCDNFAEKNTKFDGSYHTKVRNHQTCYGLMNMMGSTLKECTTEEFQRVFPQMEHFRTLEVSLTDKGINSGRGIDSGRAAEAYYRGFLERFKNTPEHDRVCLDVRPDNYICESAVCSAQKQEGAITGFSCALTVKKNGTAEQPKTKTITGTDLPATIDVASDYGVTTGSVNCQTNRSDARYTCSTAKCLPGTEGKYNCELTILDQDNAGSEEKVKQEDVTLPEGDALTYKGEKTGDAEVSCPIEKTEKYTCEKADCTGSGPFTCTLTVKDNTPGAEALPTVTKEVAERSEEITHTYEGQNISCSSPTFPPPGAKYSCTKAECTGEASPFTCTLTLKDNQPADPENNPDISVPGVSAEDKANITYKYQDKHEVTCSDSGSEDNDDGTKPTLTISITSRGEKEYKVSAKPENDEGWTLKWNVVGTGVTVAVNEGAQATQTAEEAPLADDGSASTPATPAAGQKEITQPRKDKDYQVCASLEKEGSDAVKASPECVTIDKVGSAPAIEAPKPASNNFMGGPQQPQGPPPPPIRHSSDTSAVGVQ